MIVKTLILHFISLLCYEDMVLTEIQWVFILNNMEFLPIRIPQRLNIFLSFGRNAKYLLNENSMEHFEAYTSFHKNDWSCCDWSRRIKRWRGKTNNLVYSRESIPFDWIRINIDSKIFRLYLSYWFFNMEPKTK